MGNDLYKFIDDNSTYYLHRCYVYPSPNPGVLIQNALKLSCEPPYLEAAEFSAAFIAANKKKAGGIWLINEAEIEEQIEKHSLTAFDFVYEISQKDKKIHVNVLDAQKGTHCFSGFLDDFIIKSQKEGMEKMEKIFVVMNLNSHFIGVYSCRQKAQEVVDRLKGEFLGSELIIEENPLNDLSMFNF